MVESKRLELKTSLKFTETESIGLSISPVKLAKESMLEQKF